MNNKTPLAITMRNAISVAKSIEELAEIVDSYTLHMDLWLRDESSHLFMMTDDSLLAILTEPGGDKAMALTCHCFTCTVRFIHDLEQARPELAEIMKGVLGSVTEAQVAAVAEKYKDCIATPRRRLLAKYEEPVSKMKH